jgi:hypothetical protein
MQKFIKKFYFRQSMIPLHLLFLMNAPEKRDSHVSLEDFEHAFKQTVPSYMWTSYVHQFKQAYDAGYDLMRHKMAEGGSSLGPNLDGYTRKVLDILEHFRNEWAGLDKKPRGLDVMEANYIGNLLGMIIGIARYGIASENFMYVKDDYRKELHVILDKIAATKFPDFGHVRLSFHNVKSQIRDIGGHLSAAQKEMIEKLASCLP